MKGCELSSFYSRLGTTTSMELACLSHNKGDRALEQSVILRTEVV
ncbi:hypothetical protein [Chroococcidiopsis sp.]